MRYMTRTVLCILAVLIVTVAASAQSINLRLADGSRWSGKVNDQVEMRFLYRGREVTVRGEIVRAGDRFLMLDGEFGNEQRVFTVFETDIRAIRTLVDSEREGEPKRDEVREGPRPERPGDQKPSALDDGPGVFVLPLSGGVGLGIERSQFKRMAEYVDRYGPGQIIILKLRTPGGSAAETEQIAQILFSMRERHRLIAWVDEAISAGCAIASLCHEIFFMRDGAAGSMTGFNPATGQSMTGEALQRWMHTAGEWMEAGGRSRYIAHAMIYAGSSLSYDKNSVTGEVTFYNNLTGQYILSRPGDNLTFNSNNALHSGFADGIADNEAELAKLLDLPRWREISQFGRNMHDDWHQLIARAEDQVPRLVARMGYYQTGTGDPVIILSTRIRILEELVRWLNRVPTIHFSDRVPALPPKEVLEEEIIELRRQLAQLRR